MKKRSKLVANRALKRIRSFQRYVSVVCLACWLFIPGCMFAPPHTTDAHLEQVFQANERLFASLLKSLNEDAAFEMLNKHEVRYAGTQAHIDSDLNVVPIFEGQRIPYLSRRQIHDYLNQMQQVGLLQITRSSVGAPIEFRVDKESLRNGNSSKGYYYYPDLSDSYSSTRIKSSLDGLNFKGAYPCSFLPLKNSWYLYLCFSA